MSSTQITTTPASAAGGSAVANCIADDAGAGRSSGREADK